MSRNRKIVLTGGPCAGKTTMTEVISKVFGEAVVVVPESASTLFSGGFPRWQEAEARNATQRAIYSVQCEIETVYSVHHPDKILIMDRGTIDGAPYWSTGAKDYFQGVGTTLEKELSRYDHVIYLESAGKEDYVLNVHKNPNRIETWEEATALDQVTRDLWSRHPSFEIIRNRHSFDYKIAQVLKGVEAFVRK